MKIDRYKLTVLMMSKGVTGIQLADNIGVSCATVSNIKCGKTCRDEIGKKIAEY